MINTINLSNYSFAFLNPELTDLKRKNFIYGKNGTGKSSLVKAIKEQYSDDYDIRIFDGWRGIIKQNNYLDAIALGEINVDKQTKIDEIDNKIKEIEKEIIEPQDNTENLKKKQIKIYNSYDRQNKKRQLIQKGALLEKYLEAKHLTVDETEQLLQIFANMINEQKPNKYKKDND